MNTQEISFLLRILLAEAFKAGWDERAKRGTNQYDGRLDAQLYAQQRLMEFK